MRRNVPAQTDLMCESVFDILKSDLVRQGGSGNRLHENAFTFKADTKGYIFLFRTTATQSVR